jgi:F-type H+-transporting ATPase subunit b
MRVRTIVGGLVLAVLFVVGVPSVASAAGESVGSCIVDEVQKLEGNPDAPAFLAQVEKKAEACQEAPNPILPATNEIIWGGLAFLILLVVLWKFALPPVRKTMEARTERIRNDLMQAEAAKVEAEGVLARYQAQLADSRAEGQRLIEEARQAADSVRSDLERRAQADIVEMRQRAEADVEASKQQALADVRAEVATLALGAAERVVERNLDRDTQLQLIENYINSVGATR